MANEHYDWEDLGRRIENIVDRAVSSQDFQKLNQTIRQAVDTGTEAVRSAKKSYGRIVAESRARVAPAPAPRICPFTTAIPMVPLRRAF